MNEDQSAVVEVVTHGSLGYFVLWFAIIWTIIGILITAWAASYLTVHLVQWMFR